MKVLMSGSSGLIGSALVPALRRDGCSVTRLVRHTPHGDGEIQWNPNEKAINPRLLEGFDAVIHLSGEPIIGLWTAEKKQRLRRSRIQSSELLSRALSQMSQPPRFFGCASAIGFYGHRGDEILSEGSAAGTGLLADLCRDWEAATQSAVEAEIRVAKFRIGVVLSHKSGALKPMLPPFRLGVGAQIGDGRQWLSWISLQDIVGAILHTIKQPQIRGAINLVGPQPVTQAEFVRTLGEVVQRPVRFALPSPLLKAALGEAADEMLLASQRVLPQILTGSGYQFRHPALEPLLRAEIGKR
jgi:uncharacterized protein (TIGR01777 family)